MAGIAADMANWVASTPYAGMVRSARTGFPMLIPFSLVLHLTGIAAIIGASLITGFRLLGVTGREMPVNEVARRMLPWIWGALPLMLITGFTVLCNRPGRYFRNPVFGLKMALLLVAVVITFALHRRLTRAGVEEGAATRAAGAALIFIWIAILFAGRWLPYV